MTPEPFTRTIKPAWVFFAAFIVAAIVLGLRFPDRLLDPQLRDEDGYVFLRQDAIFGFKAFILRYNGYLHTLQRAVAYVAGFAHPLWSPWIYNLSTFIITAAVCARVAVAGLPAAWRLGFCALFLLHPFCLYNAIHLTNVFWFTAALFPVFAIERAPESRFGKTSTVAVAGILGLTGPFAAFFAPLFVLRAFLMERTRYTFVLGGTVLATGLAQALLLVTSERFDNTARTEAFHLVDIWTLANRFVVHSFFVGFADETSALQSLAGFAILGLFIAGAVVALRRFVSRENAIRCGMLAAGAGLIYLAGIFGTLGAWVDIVPGESNTRYYILPYLLFGWMVVALACAPGSRWMRAPAAALLLAAALTHFRTVPFPASTWADDLQRVEREGYGIVRITPAGGHHQHFMARARGDGRFGFARGAELAGYYDIYKTFPRAFGLQHAFSLSQDASIFAFLHNLGNREGVVTCSRSHVGLAIPEGATSFSGKFGFAPVAVPSNSLDGVAGGDGILFRVAVSDGVAKTQTLFQEFIPPLSPSDPAAQRQFRIAIPPGPWRAVVIQNLAGPTGDHTTLFDFALWTDLAFQAE